MLPNLLKVFPRFLTGTTYKSLVLSINATFLDAVDPAWSKATSIICIECVMVDEDSAVFLDVLKSIKCKTTKKLLNIILLKRVDLSFKEHKMIWFYCIVKSGQSKVPYS